MKSTVSRRLVMGGAITALALPGLARAQAPVRLPLTLRAGKLFVSVSVGGAAAEAILDSGAARSALDIGFAGAAGIPTYGRYTGEMIQGRVSGARARNVVVRLGEQSLTLKDTVAVDFSRVVPGYGTPVKLLLGRELFEAFVVELDFEAATAAFTPRSQFTAPPTPAIALRPARGRMTAPIVLEDQAPIQASVDIGSDLPLILSPSPLARRLLQGRPTSTALIGAQGSNAETLVASAKRLSLGDEVFTNVPFQVAPRSLGVEAIVGLPILKRFRLTLDFGGRRMWLAPSASPKAPFERERAGMNGVAGNDGLRITHVARNGPAEKAGLKVGDLVVTIDGEMALTANANLTGAPAGRVLDLTLADGSHRKLTLAEYY